MAHRKELEIHAGEPSLGELFRQLSRDTGLLVRQEVGLVKAEVREDLGRAAKDAAAMGIGGALAHAGLLAILAAITLGLIQLGVTPWLAAALVGLACAGTGFVLIQRGRKDLSEADLTPRRTTRTLQENVQWAKEQLR
jgi:hypothetical protein